MNRPANTRAIGTAGERQAEAYLNAQGIAVLARNYRGAGGEIDLIAREGKHTVFVEVKARKNKGMGITGREAVTPAKQRRISACAMHYLIAQGLTQSFVRFDVVEITNGEVVHIRDAFPYRA